MVFFLWQWRLTGQQGQGGHHLLFHFTTSTHSRTFRHLFATLQVRWLSHIFNRTTCIYQATTRWDLQPYVITIWLIDDVMLLFVCLLDELIVSFCYSNLLRETGGLELAATITFVLQANRLTKCASHPKPICIWLIAELNAYGFDIKALTVNREHRTKKNSAYSS